VKAALEQNPERKGRRPSQSWRLASMAELNEQGTAWAAEKKVAHNRPHWKATVTPTYAPLGAQEF